MATDSVVFPLRAKKISGASRFQTNIQRGYGGVEVRNADWQDSLRRYDIAPAISTITEQQIVYTFHMACIGAAVAFLLRDYLDYDATNTVKTLTTGVAQHGTTLQLSSNVFQLQKSYGISTRTHNRRITRPEAGTIFLYDSAQQLITTGFTIDYTTGKVTSTTPVYYWSGNFYVPVRFESDEIDWDLVKFKLTDKTGFGEMPEIALVEVRE